MLDGVWMKFQSPAASRMKRFGAAPGCDLNCLVMKYEALQNAKTQAEVQLVLIDSEGEGHATEVQALQKRIANLTRHATRVRQELEEMGKEIKKQESVAAK